MPLMGIEYNHVDNFKNTRNAAMRYLDPLYAMLQSPDVRYEAVVQPYAMTSGLLASMRQLSGILGHMSVPAH